MQMKCAVLLALAGVAEAFSPSPALGLRGSGAAAVSSRKAGATSLQMGGDSLPAGPKGRGPFGPEDAFVLPDGRTYQPGDGPTDSLYGAALANPFVVPEQLKLVLGAGLIGVSVAIPTIFIKFVIGA